MSTAAQMHIKTKKKSVTGAVLNLFLKTNGRKPAVIAVIPLIITINNQYSILWKHLKLKLVVQEQ